MKRINIFILAFISCCSCIFAENKMASNDTLIVEWNKDSTSIRFCTDSFIILKKQIFETEIGKEYIGPLITISPQSLEKIEQDGGMVNILENCLIKENFDMLSPFYIQVAATAAIGKDGIGRAYSIQVRNKNKLTALTEIEMRCLLQYISSNVRFSYQKPNNNDLPEIVFTYVWRLKKE